MTDTVERVARVIAKAQLTRQYVGRLENVGAVIEIDRIWPEFMPEARAAILETLAAVREPSEPALVEGVKAMNAVIPDGVPASSVVIYGQPVKIWQAMLDKLAEEIGDGDLA